METLMLTKFKVATCAVALVSLALAPACKKDEASGGGAAGGAVSAATGTALNFMPKASTMVFGVNVASAVNAKVLSKYKDMMMAQAPKEMKEFEAACGVNIQKDIKSITVGMTEGEKAIIVINGNFNQAKVEECMTKMSEKEGEKMTMADEGKIRVYAPEGKDDKMYVHYPSDGTAVLTMTDLGGAALINDVVGREKLGDRDVMNLVKSPKTSATFWAAGNPEKLAKGSPMDQGVKGIAMTVNAGDNLDIKVLANMEDGDKAAAMVKEGKAGIEMAKQMPMAAPFKPMLEKVKMEADGKAIKVGVSLTSSDIDNIAKMAPMLMGGM